MPVLAGRLVKILSDTLWVVHVEPNNLESNSVSELLKIESIRAEAEQKWINRLKFHLESKSTGKTLFWNEEKINLIIPSS